MIIEAKKKAWQEFRSRQNQQLFYGVLKTLRKGKTARVKTKQGCLIKNNTETMKRWKEYVKELLEAVQEEDNTHRRRRTK